MRVSVVVPTYGRATSAIECVRSILRNRYSDFEILLVDQGPGDELRRAVAECFSGTDQVRYLWSTPPGLNRARNLGLEHARGQIAAFIDDDAVADEHWLAGIAATFTDTSPVPGLMAGRILPVWPGARPRWLPRDKEVLLGLYDLGEAGRPMPDGDLPIGANMAGPREALLAVGGFHGDLEADSQRPGVPLTGGDSLLAQQLKESGYTLYYQPRATVYHKISSSKLRPFAFVKRHYWEGITEVTRMHLGGTITPANAAAVATHHRERVVQVLCGACTLTTWCKRGISRRASAIALLAQLAHSIGGLYALREVVETPGNERNR